MAVQLCTPQLSLFNPAVCFAITAWFLPFSVNKNEYIHKNYLFSGEPAKPPPLHTPTPLGASPNYWNAKYANGFSRLYLGRKSKAILHARMHQAWSKATNWTAKLDLCTKSGVVLVKQHCQTPREKVGVNNWSRWFRGLHDDKYKTDTRRGNTLTTNSWKLIIYCRH